VSITEDATMSRTRSEGGATVVRLVAIAMVGCLGFWEKKLSPALRRVYFPIDAKSMEISDGGKMGCQARG